MNILLYEFLHNEKIYDKFINNFEKHTGTKYNKRKHNIDDIYSSFDWETTDEGMDFWIKINKKWEAFKKENS